MDISKNSKAQVKTDNAGSEQAQTQKIRQHKKVNITVIAENLGISISTVSRALSVPEKVSLITRQKVLAEAQRLGYLNRTQISNKNTDKYKTIGIIVADLDNSFANSIIKAAVTALSEKNYTALITTSYERTDLERKILKQYLSMELAGLIIMPSKGFMQNIENFKPSKPIVLIDRKPSQNNIASVIEDNIKGVHLALKHLAELGHKKIFFITGLRKIYTFNERCKGVENFVETHKNNIEVGISEIYASGYEELFLGAFEQTNLMLLTPKGTRPTAIIGANNAITAGILYALNLKGIKVPEEISVISYGDSDWCRFYPTPITALRQPVDEMGNRAAAMLMVNIENNQHTNEVVCLESMLLKRASTASPRTI
jgi:LacI family transcriptional regulator